LDSESFASVFDSPNASARKRMPANPSNRRSRRRRLK
jgi:hypothetical protein